MESLLASYGSDHDSDDEEPNPQPLASSTPLHRPSKPSPLASPLQSSNPQQSHTPLPSKNSLFAALPPPKLPPSSTLPTPPVPSLPAAPVVGRTEPFHLAEKEVSASSRAALASAPPGQQESARSSLFRSLPPPKCAESAPVASPGPSGAQPAVAPHKRVVKFTPSINKALLDIPEEDDEPQRKRRIPETVAGLSGKGSGLAAILPRPKNLGVTLGGGTAGGGRRMALETTDHAIVSETRSAEIACSLGNSLSSVHVDNTFGTEENSGHVGEGTGALADAFDSDTRAWTEQTAYGFREGRYNFSSSDSVAAAFAPEGNVGVPYHQNEGVPGEGAFNVDGSNISNSASFNADDALANLLMKEKRRGNKEAPPNIIELKQADLTASKVREEQLRTTGIAFGPAYKPVSSNKDKPSKLHRRKHQIGSLFFDMKQKEIELLERRAKGNMTKSETQAKYGW